MFNREATFPVKIVEVAFAAPRFKESQNDPNAFDVCIKVEDEQGLSDWWYGEYSGRYGIGNSSDRTWAQLTMETLQKIGLPNGDLAQLQGLIGKQTMATTVASTSGSKTFYNVRYLGGGGSEPEKIDPNEAIRRAQSMMQGQQQGGFQPNQNQGGGFQPPQQGQQQGGFQQNPNQQPQQNWGNPQPNQNQGQAGYFGQQ